MEDDRQPSSAIAAHDTFLEVIDSCASGLVQVSQQPQSRAPPRVHRQSQSVSHTPTLWLHSLCGTGRESLSTFSGGLHHSALWRTSGRIPTPPMMDIVKSVREHISGWTNGGETSWYAFFPKILVATLTGVSYVSPAASFSSNYTPPAQTGKETTTFTRPTTPF